MISVIITSYNEPKTIGRAIESFKQEKFSEPIEIIVCAPDKETLNKAKKYKVKTVQDKGLGKPAALNNVIKKARGEIIILTDGDVYTKDFSNLLSHFKDKSVGAVSGRVYSANSKNSLFGFWAYILSESFHNLRIKESKENKNIVCSGYFYAIRKNLFEPIPEGILADDAYISFLINRKGYKTVYEPKSSVFVKYPSNLPDWIRQKKRTAGRFYQLKKYFQLSKASSLKQEIVPALLTIKKLNSPKEFFYYFLLIVMRAYIWSRVFFDFRLWKRSFKNTWQRVESTK